MFKHKEAAPTPHQTEELPNFDKVFDLSKYILPAVSGLRHTQEMFEREKVRVERQKSELFAQMFQSVSKYYELLQDKKTAGFYESGLVVNTKTAKGRIQLPSYEARDRLAVVLFGEITEEPQDVSVKIIRSHTTENVSLYRPPAMETFEVEIEHPNGFLAINLSEDKRGNCDIYTVQRSNKPEIRTILVDSMRPHTLDQKAEDIFAGAQILLLLSKIQLAQPEAPAD